MAASGTTTTAPIGIDAPSNLGFVFVSMDATEALSRCFEYTIEVLTPVPDLRAIDVVGQFVTVHLEVRNEHMRHFNGLIATLAKIGRDRDHTMYRLTVRPSLWLLTKAGGCRIFHDLNVLSIVVLVLGPYNVEVDLSEVREAYPIREFSVQYRETDFNFISRLMEREGIYYYFRHDSDKHTMVLVDTPAVAHTSFLDYTSIPFRAPDSHRAALLESVSEWSLRSEAQTGRYAHADYDFEVANALLFKRTPRPTFDVETVGLVEVYDYPGGFASVEEGEKYATLRLEQLQALREVGAGVTNARGLSVGYQFALTDYPDAVQNATYLVTAASYRLRGHDLATGKPPEEVFSCRFTAQDPAAPFRPQPFATTPVVRGPQTAVVVGPAGKEIWTDKYGRIKVQFHWDLQGQHDEKSSCFVRVAQVWAGSGWGAVQTPRVGQEVIVDFLEGNPDKPIVTGCVYNSTHMPPFDVTKHPTQSGIRSHSSPGGSPANFNEIRFEDRKGQEDLFIQAENTQTTNVKGSQSIRVGGDRELKVEGDDETLVNREQTIKVSGNRKVTVGGQQTVDIKSSSVFKSQATAFFESHELAQAKAPAIWVDGDSIQVASSIASVYESDVITLIQSPMVTVAADAAKLEGGKTLAVAGGEVAITGSSVTITCGDTTIEVTKDGVSIKGTRVKLNC